MKNWPQPNFPFFSEKIRRVFQIFAVFFGQKTTCLSLVLSFERPSRGFSAASMVENSIFRWISPKARTSWPFSPSLPPSEWSHQSKEYKMLGISYGELFLLIGATAALVGTILSLSLSNQFPIPFLPLLFELLRLISRWKDQLLLFFFGFARAKGSSDYRQNSWENSGSSNRICSIGSRTVWKRYATVTSSSGTQEIEIR